MSLQLAPEDGNAGFVLSAGYGLVFRIFIAGERSRPHPAELRELPPGSCCGLPCAQVVEKFLTWQVVEVKGPRLSFCAVVSGGRFRTGDVLK